MEVSCLKDKVSFTKRVRDFDQDVVAGCVWGVGDGDLGCTIVA